MPDPITVETILTTLGDATIRISGPLNRTVTHVAPIQEAQNAAAVTFCRKTGPEGKALIEQTAAGVILCPAELLGDAAGPGDKTLIAVREPRLNFLRIIQALFVEPFTPFIH